MHIAFGVFANAKIQCEESVSSSTPQNCATTNAGTLKIRAICEIRLIRDSDNGGAQKPRLQWVCVNPILFQRLFDSIQSAIDLHQRSSKRETQVVICTEAVSRYDTDTRRIEQIVGNIH